MCNFYYIIKTDGLKTYKEKKISFSFVGSTSGNPYIDFDVSQYVDDCYSWTWQAINDNKQAFSGLVTSIGYQEIYRKIMRVNLDRSAGACAFTLIGVQFKE